MNATPVTEWVNPWSNRDELTPPDKRTVIFSILALLVSAVVLPLCSYEPLCFAVLAYLFFYVVLMARSPRSVAVLLLTVFLAVSLSSVFTYRFAVGAVLLAAVVGVGATAFLLTALKRGWIVLLVPLLSCAIVFFVTKSAPAALLTFYYLPAGVLLALATRLGKGRTTAVCFAEAGLLLTLVGGLGVLLFRDCRGAGLALPEYFAALRESTFEVMVELRSAMAEFLAENPEMNDEMAQQMMETLNDGFLQEGIRQIFHLLPAILCALCGVIAFEGQLLLNASYRSMGWVQVLTPEAQIFTMSIPAAILYFVTFLISLFGSGQSFAVAVAQNLNLILMPGFCVIAAHAFSFSLARARGGARAALLVIAAALLCCNVGGGLYLLALFGANSVVLGALMKKLRKKSSGDSGPSL